MDKIFLFGAIISIFWGVVSSIVIISYISRRGVKINYFLLKLLILKYVHDYYKITKEESGKPGPWFYSYITSMNLALIFVVIGIILRNT